MADQQFADDWNALPETDDGQYFRDNFNTELTPEEAEQFAAWKEAHKAKTGRDLTHEADDYDLAGAWKEHGENVFDPESNHGTDKFKKPNHPTFSNQSQYHGADNERFGGKWEGGAWSAEGDAYTPSKRMLETTHPAKFLRDYMATHERGVRLVMP